MKTGAFIYIACGLAAALVTSCDRSTPREKNLLQNPSFEDVEDGLPAGWRINNFRGLADMKATTYRLNERQVHDGKYSFNFYAEEDAKRFFTLSQEVAVKDVKTVRAGAWIKTVGVDQREDQYPQAGIGLTFYNKFRGRFDSRTFADVRTDPLYGTTDGWQYVEGVWRLPENTAFIEVHCVLGMTGRIWFDDVSLDIPEGLPWNEEKGELFTRYWLDEKPYPEGSLDFQERMYTFYATRLGIPPEIMPGVFYYLYPSAEILHEATGFEGNVKVDFDHNEIHSIYPADDHEIVHLLTNSVGRLPRLLAEGTAFYLMDNYNGQPIQPQAQNVLRAKKLPTLRNMLDPTAMRGLPPQYLIPAAASFVGYLLEFGGTERFKDLHRRSNADMEYEAFSQAFRLAYAGGSLEDAEKVWVATLDSADFSKFEREQREGTDPQ